MLRVQRVSELVPDAEAPASPVRVEVDEDCASASLGRGDERRFHVGERLFPDFDDIQSPGDLLDGDRSRSRPELLVDCLRQAPRVGPDVIQRHPVQGRIRH